MLTQNSTHGTSDPIDILPSRLFHNHKLIYSEAPIYVIKSFTIRVVHDVDEKNCDDILDAKIVRI